MKTTPINKRLDQGDRMSIGFKPIGGKAANQQPEQVTG